MVLNNIRAERCKGLSQLEKKKSHANLFPILSGQENICYIYFLLGDGSVKHDTTKIIDIYFLYLVYM